MGEHGLGADPVDGQKGQALLSTGISIIIIKYYLMPKLLAQTRLELAKLCIAIF